VNNNTSKVLEEADPHGDKVETSAGPLHQVILRLILQAILQAILQHTDLFTQLHLHTQQYPTTTQDIQLRVTTLVELNIEDFSKLIHWVTLLWAYWCFFVSCLIERIGGLFYKMILITSIQICKYHLCSDIYFLNFSITTSSKLYTDDV
jgi:hypothetical protein